METTATNFTESNTPTTREDNRSTGWDSRNKWRTRAQWRGKMLKQAQQDLIQARQDLVQALADYDELELELRNWLKIEDGYSPNPNLVNMAHLDLAILADQYRRKLITLHKAGEHHVPA